jgi:hypothetical protein
MTHRGPWNGLDTHTPRSFHDAPWTVEDRVPLRGDTTVHDPPRSEPVPGPSTVDGTTSTETRRCRACGGWRPVSELLLVRLRSGRYWFVCRPNVEPVVETVSQHSCFRLATPSADLASIHPADEP